MATKEALNLYSGTITTALTADVGTEQIVPDGCTGLVLQYNMFVGGGGTDLTAWVQCSIDGSNWVDVSAFNATTSSLRKVSAVQGALAHTHATPTDGALADNTDIDGWIGSKIRVKVTSTGTYTTASTFNVHCRFVA
jgi:hypothetical protein